MGKVLSSNEIDQLFHEFCIFTLPLSLKVYQERQLSLLCKRCFVYILGFSVCTCAFAKAKLHRVFEVLCRVLWTGHACELWILTIDVPIT